MPDWYSVRLPREATWMSHPEFCRSAIVTEARKFDSSAFAGRNLMRVFDARHTQRDVVLEPVIVLVDVPRERVVLAAFPSVLGLTIGNGIPMPTDEQYAVLRRRETIAEVRRIGVDEELRHAAASAEQRVANENGIRRISVDGPNGPDGGKWGMYLQQISARPSDFLEADGHTLTQSGAHRVALFVRGVVLALREWIPDRDGTQRGELDVEVTKTSPIAGPSLEESLAPTEADPPKPSPRTDTARSGAGTPGRNSGTPQSSPGWYQNQDGDEQWWDGNQWGPYPPPPRVQTVYTVAHPESKSLAVAYLLFFTLGWYGAHRFYMGNTGHGVGILLTGLATYAFGIAAVAEGLNDVSGDSVPMLTSTTSGVTIVLSILMIMFLVPELFALPRDVVDHNTPLMTSQLQARRRRSPAP